MMHRAWNSIVEVPYFFSRSSVKFQGHTALKIVEFDPNWAFPDCNSSLNSPMAMKCCTKHETAKDRCPIVFQGHPSNFKVTRYKTSPILTQIGCFRTIGRSQLSNPSDLPCLNTCSCISGMGGPINMEWKGNESIGCYSYYVTLSCDFDLGFWRSNFAKALIIGIRGWIDIKGYESIGCSVGNSVKKLQVLMAWISNHKH